MKARFDIFISFKATENGEVTDDVAVATELYHTLSSCGYRVFFSSQTLLKGGSSDFSKEIDAALDDARLLIVVASKPEYLSSRWVEYEWKSFHADILSNVKQQAQIVTFTKDFDTRTMPRVLRYVQNFRYDSKAELTTFVQCFLEGKELSATDDVQTMPPGQAAIPDHTLYNSAHSGEYEILRLRSRRSYSMDRQAIEKVKSVMGRKSYNVLLLGCAYGFVAETRFGLDDDIENVICIDKNPAVLEKARELYSGYPHMKFYQVCVQSDDYVSQIRAVMAQCGIAAFDMVFISDLFRYLNDPRVTLRNTRKLLASDGMLIVRDCDDSNKLAYPDTDRCLERITSLSERIPGMPNYYIGRELPILIRNSGYSICDTMLDIQTTLNLSYEEKEEFFTATFGSRKNIVKQIVDNDVTASGECQKLIDAIGGLESLFYNGDFWYSESNLLFIAGKE